VETTFFATEVKAVFTSLGHWVSVNILHPHALLQVAVAGLAYFLAWLLARKIGRLLEGQFLPDAPHSHFRLNPAHFALVTQFVLWLLTLWFFLVLFAKLKLSTGALRVTIDLGLALLAIRFAALYIQNRFWVHTLYVACALVTALRLFGLWDATVNLLESMTIDLGTISFSLWGIIKAMAVFVVLWAAGSVANRFFAHWLSGATHLTYSDRVLIQRTFNATVAAIVILVSLHAAGIHMAAIAFTGGVVGIAIGMGLQKMGSNFVSGIHLLLAKPIRQGDVIVLDDAFSGARYGWVTRIGMMYVHMATRDSTEHLVPNEMFLTQKIENLSYSDNRVRIRIPFGIAYKSDLKKAMTLALEAARGTDRVLKAPEPACIVTEFGDSNVMFQALVWVEDPRQGLGRIRSNVLLAIWETFHNNGIEFAFPQRDVHIVDGGMAQGGIDIAARTLAANAEASGGDDSDFKR
jgi:small-conductance mechanosensitive channel